MDISIEITLIGVWTRNKTRASEDNQRLQLDSSWKQITIRKQSYGDNAASIKHCISSGGFNCDGDGMMVDSDYNPGLAPTMLQVSGFYF